MFIAGNAFASPLSFSSLGVGTNITTGDRIANSTYYTGSQPMGQGGEDNETETGTYIGQMWDLEGMYYNQGTHKLTIIGGANFTGIYFNGHTYPTGDLFLGHFGTSGYVPSYAFQFSRSSANLGSSGTGTIFGPNVSGSSVSDVSQSNPYEYKSGGTSRGSFSYTTGEVTDSPFSGWNWLNPNGSYDSTKTNDTHFFLQLSGLEELDNLITSRDNIFHLTLSCGNDTIRGEAAPVPEPSTLLLLASGLAGLVGFGLRRKSDRKRVVG